MIRSENISKGKSGEDLASKYLLKKGFQIVEKNFRSGRFGEIDIVCKKDDLLVFVEVRSKTNLNRGTPTESINNLKRERILKSAKYFLMKYPKYSNFNLRFDFIGIKVKGKFFRKTEIEHIENVFSCDEF
ncbi:MAG: YraN family protein [bacterium]|nr:YraN family protein [bacterium]